MARVEIPETLAICLSWMMEVLIVNAGPGERFHNGLVCVAELVQQVRFQSVLKEQALVSFLAELRHDEAIR